MRLLKEVLKEIKPSKEEEKEVNERISSFLVKVNKGLKDAKAILGGSGAKGTWLSKAYDADIFVQFDYRKYKGRSAELSDILERHLKKRFTRIKRLHGSRDYFQIKKNRFTFEIVPILKITKAKQAMNITDVSPLHAKWVKRYRKLADDIRLTKQFCKAQGVYGAESYIMGFSGYQCEILTIYYGGFMKLIRAGAKWEPKTIIDVEKYYRNRNEVLFKLNKSKLVSPLVTIDPVQADRNAAAAMSEEKYLQFVDACKEFLRAPSKEFFEVREISVEELRKRAGKDKLILLDVKAMAGKEDVVGSKLLKGVEFIRDGLKQRDFKVYGHGWKWDKGKKALFWFIVDKKDLPEYVERKGPPIRNKYHVEKFKKKHKKTFVRGRFIWAKDKRKFRDSSKLVKELIKDKYVKEKVKDIKAGH